MRGVTLAATTGNEDAAAALAPRAYRILVAHGFVEDVHGKGVFSWMPGEIVDRPATIALLKERGAVMEPVE